MFSAVEEHKLHFRFVHEPDGGPIGYDKVCKAEGRPVPDSEIVKAFEVEKGEFVYMADEDFETAEAEAQGGRTIDIRAFVPYHEIDPIYFERTYYLGRPDFWQKTVQNWQSEFLAVGTMAVFTIYLRQRGSAELKPVGAPHNQTGTPLPAIHACFWPAITRRQSPPSPLPRLASLACGRVRTLAWCSRPRS